MQSDKATHDAAQHLTAGADLKELRSPAEDLRALSPDSALAQLVEEKIERMGNEAGEPCDATAP